MKQSPFSTALLAQFPFPAPKLTAPIPQPLSDAASDLLAAIGEYGQARERYGVQCGRDSTFAEYGDDDGNGDRVLNRIEAALVRQAAENEALLEALKAVYRYGADTLSGRADGGPDDRAWQREAVAEMTKRARAAIDRSES